AWYRSTPVLAYAGTMLSIWLVLGLVIYPGINDYKSGRGLMLAVEEQLAPEQPLALVDWKEQTILQARRPVTNFGFLVPRDQQISDGIAWLNAHPRGRLLVQGRSMNPCFDREQAIVVGYANRRDWYLVSPSAVLPACDPMTPGRVQAGG
ncbi:MAG: dolichyl-phosphate-mannose--protein mannosyltransferase, partial [Pseudomonadota bacterium]